MERSQSPKEPDMRTNALAVLETPTQADIPNWDNYTAAEIIARRESLLTELGAALKTLKHNKLVVGRLLAELRDVTHYGDWEKVLEHLCSLYEISRSSAYRYLDAHEQINFPRS